MGAWIEIILIDNTAANNSVAPHDGCVDWNGAMNGQMLGAGVAPHDGCVDWNLSPLFLYLYYTLSHPTMGAWIEISKSLNNILVNSSHPTMGAWIEIIFLKMYLIL